MPTSTVIIIGLLFSIAMILWRIQEGLGKLQETIEKEGINTRDVIARCR